MIEERSIGAGVLTFTQNWPKEDKMIESDFAKHYSEESFSEKISNYALAVGKEGIRDALILYALVLYYTLRDSGGKVPAWAKGAIIGALGYFIFPLDVIPDMIPITGLTDDLAIIASVMSLIASNIPSEAKQRANEKMMEWFGEEDQIQIRNFAFET
jgi:uncharacterized membrane protein YkvA (DUF1232 family)